MENNNEDNGTGMGGQPMPGAEPPIQPGVGMGQPKSSTQAMTMESTFGASEKPKDKSSKKITIILVAIVVVAALVFGGIYLWSMIKEDRAADGNSGGAGNGVTGGDRDDEDEMAGGVLAIGDWGVGFEIPSDLTNVRYTIEGLVDSENSGIAVAYFTADASDGSFTFSADDGPVFMVSLARSLNADDFINYPDAFKIGDYYYVNGYVGYGPPTTDGFSEGFLKVLNSLSAAINNLEEV